MDFTCLRGECLLKISLALPDPLRMDKTGRGVGPGEGDH